LVPELVEALSSERSNYGRFTVFAPSNAAIERYLLSNGIEDLEEFIDSPSAVDIMLYHVVNGQVRNTTIIIRQYK
jgi:uncharacterized surface protein with fasciclin (FAS1) repeats